MNQSSKIAPATVPTSCAAAVQLPSRKETIRHAIASLSQADLGRVRKYVDRAPDRGRLVKAYWGGGARLDQMARRQMEQGLARAVEQDPEIAAYVLAGAWAAKGHQALVAAVNAAQSRWSDANGLSKAPRSAHQHSHRGRPAARSGGRPPP